MKIAVATLGERFDDRDVIKSLASVATHLKHTCVLLCMLAACDCIQESNTHVLSVKGGFGNDTLEEMATDNCFGQLVKFIVELNKAKKISYVLFPEIIRCEQIKIQEIFTEQIIEVNRAPRDPSVREMLLKALINMLALTDYFFNKSVDIATAKFLTLRSQYKVP